MAKQRELNYRFDDDFNYAETYHRNKQRFAATAKKHVAAMVQSITAEGWDVPTRYLTQLEERVVHNFGSAITEAVFQERFAPIQEWLDANDYRLAPERGKFYQTRTYRLRSKSSWNGFIITFGTVADAIHFRLRWGGTII